MATAACTVREVNISTEKHSDSGPYENDNGSGGDISTAEHCPVSNGTHKARVDYRNAANGRIYSNDMDVEVSDCHVVRIYFPEHLLDETNMTAVAINSSGQAYATDREGHHYNIYIRDAVSQPSPDPPQPYRVPAPSGGHACTGSATCTVCKNCRYCKYCAKNGGTCGVCR